MCYSTEGINVKTKSHHIESHHSPPSSGNFSSLKVSFDLRRQNGYHVLQTYIPTILIVVISWVSFWLDPNAIPGRVSLGVTTLLTLTTLASGIRAQLPPVSYVKVTLMSLTHNLIFLGIALWLSLSASYSLLRGSIRGSEIIFFTHFCLLSNRKRSRVIFFTGLCLLFLLFRFLPTSKASVYFTCPSSIFLCQFCLPSSLCQGY